MTVTPLIPDIDPADPATVLPIALATCKLSVPNDATRWPGAALDGLADAIEALEAAMLVVHQVKAFEHPDPVVAWRTEGARRREGGA